jgi:hypothetical protein
MGGGDADAFRRVERVRREVRLHQSPAARPPLVFLFLLVMPRSRPWFRLNKYSRALLPPNRNFLGQKQNNNSNSVDFVSAIETKPTICCLGFPFFFF